MYIHYAFTTSRVVVCPFRKRDNYKNYDCFVKSSKWNRLLRKTKIVYKWTMKCEWRDNETEYKYAHLTVFLWFEFKWKKIAVTKMIMHVSQEKKNDKKMMYSIQLTCKSVIKNHVIPSVFHCYCMWCSNMT